METKPEIVSSWNETNSRERKKRRNKTETEPIFFCSCFCFWFLILLWAQSARIREHVFETYPPHYFAVMSSYLIWTYRNQTRKRKSYINEHFVVVAWNPLQYAEKQWRKNKRTNSKKRNEIIVMKRHRINASFFYVCVYLWLVLLLLLLKLHTNQQIIMKWNEMNLAEVDLVISIAMCRQRIYLSTTLLIWCVECIWFCKFSLFLPAFFSSTLLGLSLSFVFETIGIATRRIQWEGLTHEKS